MTYIGRTRLSSIDPYADKIYSVSNVSGEVPNPCGFIVQEDYSLILQEDGFGIELECPPGPCAFVLQENNFIVLLEDGYFLELECNNT